MSHLGIKPVNGGSPPRDKRMRGVIAVNAGAFTQARDSALMFVELYSLNRMNAENVIIRYRIRVRSVSVGEYCNTTTIHPRWAIEE